LTFPLPVAEGQHVLVSYIWKPKVGHDFLASAASFAAVSSTAVKAHACTTDDLARAVDAMVYYLDPVNEEMKAAYPTFIFYRNITDDRAMMSSVLSLSFEDVQGMWSTSRSATSFSRSSTCAWSLAPLAISWMCGVPVGVLLGTVASLSARLSSPRWACCPSFMARHAQLSGGGGFIQHDEPEGFQVSCQNNDCASSVVTAMKACMIESCFSQPLSAIIVDEGPDEMHARGKHGMSQLGPLGCYPELSSDER
jgi:ribulose-bisphosphate carboxylase large chain